MTDSKNEAPDSLKTISIDMAVEMQLSQSTDHTALARQLIKDNFRLLNTSRVLLQEYEVVRAALVDMARASSGPVAFTARRVIAESTKRLDATVDSISVALGETVPTQQGGAA